ncbi:MAG: substrate-binding domain-containing protein [Verrucomicrobiaceae bacterium]|nr:substrate-binding domain-containing protein [Verrucomicrobiaceae bacterium]
MSTPSFLTLSDQVTEHLRSEILRGRWSGALPGKHQLAAELGVNNKTVESALRQLEKTGLLLPQGAGRKRLINTRRRSMSRTLRIALLLNDHVLDEKTKLVLEIKHALDTAGHTIITLPKSLTTLRFDPKLVAALVRKTEADAWLILAASRSVLEWFAGQSMPAFAVFGNRFGIKIPSVSPNKPPVIAEATRHLISLGHRRIAMLAKRAVRMPHPTVGIAAYLDTLHTHGCQPSEFNLPDWDETNAGFHACLSSLFRATPPTALIVDEVTYFVAAMQFLLREGLKVPADVSLISTDDDVAFSHCDPPVACMRWDMRPVVRRIVQWAANVSRGKPDFAQTLTPAEFVSGGTVGPASTSSRR